MRCLCLQGTVQYWQGEFVLVENVLAAGSRIGAFLPLGAGIQASWSTWRARQEIYLAAG